MSDQSTALAEWEKQRMNFRFRGKRDEPWPWLDELLAHAKRNGSRMCDKWDGYDDGERYSITIAGGRLIRKVGSPSRTRRRSA